MKSVILAGGGTGGHVYPALAMGEALRARGHGLIYYGDAERLEGRVAPERGVPFRAVRAPQFPRAGLIGKARFLIALLSAVAAARAMLQAEPERPGLVLGVGGYIMAPTVLAAWTLGIPAVVHEANVAPGLANRLCARVARLVLLTYAQSQGRLKTGAEVVTVGCPVNPKILGGDRTAAAARYGLDPARPTLLVVGGSLGAATINAVALACAALPTRTRGGQGWQLLHIAGPRYLEDVRRQYAALSAVEGRAGLPEGVALIGYEDRMGDAFAASDLALCRAGSSTLAELAAVGKPSVLIPSPNVTDNHQEANARGLESAGAARVVVEQKGVPDGGIDAAEVATQIGALIQDAAALAEMGKAAAALGRLGVAEQVADLLQDRFLR